LCHEHVAAFLGVLYKNKNNQKQKKDGKDKSTQDMMITVLGERSTRLFNN